MDLVPKGYKIRLALVPVAPSRATTVSRERSDPRPVATSGRDVVDAGGGGVEDADAHAAAVLVAVGTLSRGFRLANAGLQIYAETDVFEEERRPSEKRRSLTQTFLSDLREPLFARIGYRLCRLKRMKLP